VPRIAAIEHPFGRTMGSPGDRTTQMAVLKATLAAIDMIETPGEIVHLPFEWPKISTQEAEYDFPPPPITTYLKKNNRQVFKFVKRDTPPESQV